MAIQDMQAFRSGRGAKKQIKEKQRWEIKLFFAWSDAMSVGIAEIDEQHKMLVDILNRLFLAVVQRESNAITIEILDTLVDYTKTHFGLGEKLLQDAEYDSTEFAAHQREHHAFVEKISTVASKHLVEGKSVPSKSSISSNTGCKSTFSLPTRNTPPPCKAPAIRPRPGPTSPAPPWQPSRRKHPSASNGGKSGDTDRGLPFSRASHD